jgi:hypothetical protein
MSIHRGHVFACELTEGELVWVKQNEKENTSFGVGEDTERTCIFPCFFIVVVC